MKINGKKYKKEKYIGQQLSAYYKHGVLVDSVSEKDMNKVSKYIDCEYGRVGIISNSKRLILIPFIVVVLMLVVLIIYICRNYMLNDSDVRTHGVSKLESLLNDTVIGELGRTGEEISYNQYCTYKEGLVDIMLVNIDKETTIRLEGKNIVSDIKQCSPKEIVTDIPVTLGSETDLPVRAILIITADEKDYKCPLVVNSYDGIPYSKLDTSESDDFKEVLVK